MEKPVKEGCLLFPPHGVLGQLKKSWHKKFCQLYCASKQGIERLEIFENEEEASKTTCGSIITFENCVKITQDPQKSHPYSFSVVTRTNIYSFAGNSEKEMLEWISAFQRVAFEETISKHTIEQDNELYCSTADNDLFLVELTKTEASERCGLKEGNYYLVLLPAELQLQTVSDNLVILTWPYRYIRRYSYNKITLTFEAGRKCQSGEGKFCFETIETSGLDIYRSLTNKVKTIKQLLTCGDSGLALSYGDLQLQHHALRMSARSRSPLPPFPCESNIHPLRSIKPNLPKPPLTMAPSEIPPRPIEPKPKPQKPPRKNLPKSDEDEIEIPKPEARKLSCGDIKSTSNNKEESKTLPNKGNIIIQKSTGDNYELLNHFGSTSQLDVPGYRQINSIVSQSSSSTSGIQAQPVKPLTNDEECKDEIISARLADDSHNGYGIIRKKSTPNDEFNRINLKNPVEYSFILKPHRV